MLYLVFFPALLLCVTRNSEGLLGKGCRTPLLSYYYPRRWVSFYAPYFEIEDEEKPFKGVRGADGLLTIKFRAPIRVVGIASRGYGVYANLMERFILTYYEPGGKVVNYKDPRDKEDPQSKWSYFYTIKDDAESYSVNWFYKPLTVEQLDMTILPKLHSCNGSECWNIFCFEVDVLGCGEDLKTDKERECRATLGVIFPLMVKDEQMTASSAHAEHPPYYGRLLHRTLWCVDPVLVRGDPVAAKSQYLQVDFLVPKDIRAIATRGCHVQDYYVYYATDESVFHSLRHRDRNEKMLLGNRCAGKLRAPHYNWLRADSFVARYVRINPQHWNDNICLGVDFFGCDAGTTPLGMEFDIVSEDQIIASSEETANHKNRGRLNSGGWCASRKVLSSVSPGKVLYHFLQIDSWDVLLVCGVATQGKETKNPEERPEAVTSFYLKYSFKGDEWFRYHRLLVGEYHGNSVMQYWLDPPVVTRFIQFNPQSSWSPKHLCMRVEIYTCKSQGDLENYLPLGMESFTISDAQLSASSEANDSHSAACSRLNHHIHGGAWIPAKSDRSEFLQIDLAWIVFLTGIAIQGHPEKPYRTLAFKIRYGITLDEENFKDYPKEFDGNVQEGSTVFDVINPTRCRVVRIIPLSWSEKVGLRAELYGYETVHCLHHLLGVRSPAGPTLFSASSSANVSLPAYGHLHSGLGTGAWCAEVQDANQYLQVDLKGVTTITGVATQGEKNFDSWVLSFTLAYCLDGRTWNDYTGMQFLTQVFTGNKDRDTAVLHFFEVPLLAGYLRFQPQKWRNKICMRVQIYGCALKVAFCTKCAFEAVCVKESRLSTGTCVCKPGYFGNGKTCKDMDECSNKINPCPENSDCSNTVGSYNCKCHQGFVYNDWNCIDIDECTDPDRCSYSASCVNTPGSFTCNCGTGIAYDTDSQSCKDIDECSVGSFQCHPLASCVNTNGSYTCLCADGYTGHGKVTCVDVNECRQDSKVCPPDAVCENTRGSYTCVCPAGFVWKNNKCEDACKPGFIFNGPHCIDHNECLSDTHSCDANAWCTNTVGSYKCFCKEGYRGNGFLCVKEFG